MAPRRHCPSSRRTPWLTPFSIAWRGCLPDPREQLRRYLEQRRELGESELMLDKLSADEALALLGARPRASASAVAPDDWRATLRAAGAEPGRPGTGDEAAGRSELEENRGREDGVARQEIPSAPP